MDKPTLNIVKIGGQIINDPTALKSFLNDFSSLEGPKILIHGGGKKATEIAVKLGLKPKMVMGRRITDQPNLEVAVMVYAGLINKNIIAQLQKNSCNALGLTGADANIIRASIRKVTDIDFGFAGDIESVDPRPFINFLKYKYTPVLAAITHDTKGQLLNTNADTIAAEVAAALTAQFDVVLTYCFDKKGVLMDINDENSVIENMNTTVYMALKESHKVVDGMLPKLFNCFYALNQGVSKVIIGKPSVIINNQQKHTTITL